MLKELQLKYGEAFNWFEPSSKRVLEVQLAKELIPEHPLFGLSLKAVGKNERNDDVLFSDSKDYYLIHLTWSAGTKNYPHYRKIDTETIRSALEEDYLYN